MKEIYIKIFLKICTFGLSTGLIIKNIATSIDQTSHAI